MTPSTKLNRRLFRRVMARIAQAPEAFQMPNWGVTEYRDGEPCRTACCIAGETLLLSGATTVSGPELNGGTVNDYFGEHYTGPVMLNFRSTPALDDKLSKLGRPRTSLQNVLDPWSHGAALLGLGDRSPSHIFYTTSWPKRFQTAFNKAKTAKGQASAAVRRLQFYLDTNGTDERKVARKARLSPTPATA